MSTIKAFIQNKLIDRMKKSNILVVYDPDLLYRELCLQLANNEVKVIDASESSILSREEALLTLNQLGQSNTQIKGLVVYVPVKVPLTDEEKQIDPFALYTVCGSVFPDSDSDQYLELCLIAKPDYATEIRRIFKDNTNPSFEVIDAVGDRGGWPTLQTLLKAESAREILIALLVPSDNQIEALKKQDNWIAEAKELFRSTLGLNLITRNKSWESIAEELWRFILFSEFAFDTNENLPDSLIDVPHANSEAKGLVLHICESLRNNNLTQSAYIERAEIIEKDLDLPKRCQKLTDLGERDTFPFEERFILKKAVEVFIENDTDTLREILNRRLHSIWIGNGENQTQWTLIQAALNLVEACMDNERQLPNYTLNQDSIINFYISSMREVDRLHREFEHVLGDSIEINPVLDDVIKIARKSYQNLSDKVHKIFIKHFEKDGWPPIGRLYNAEVFDRIIAPIMQHSGRRVAFMLIDALRYELGVVLEKQLAEDVQVELKPAFAHLPTNTQIGMASLLPGATQDFKILRGEKGDIIPVLGDTSLTNVNQRMEYLNKKYGQRFAEMTLKKFLKTNSSLPSTVDLLVLRSDYIDSQMEIDPETALGQIHDSLKRIRAAVHKLERMGFNEVVIATDHGFVLNTTEKPGNVCSKPTGDWTNIHDRSLLGRGMADNDNFVIPTERAGIKGDYEQVAGPKALVPYKSGKLYFHGGVSVHETILPVLTLKLNTKDTSYEKPSVSLEYKKGAKRITTKIPVIEVNLDYYNLFSPDIDFQVIIEAQDKQGDVVGEAKAGGPVNPATGTITLRPGERLMVPLKMDPEFEGEFKVKAIDPLTMIVYCSIELETDYVVK